MLISWQIGTSQLSSSKSRIRQSVVAAWIFNMCLRLYAWAWSRPSAYWYILRGLLCCHPTSKGNAKASIWRMAIVRFPRFVVFSLFPGITETVLISLQQAKQDTCMSYGYVKNKDKVLACASYDGLLPFGFLFSGSRYKVECSKRRTSKSEYRDRVRTFPEMDAWRHGTA